MTHSQQQLDFFRRADLAAPARPHGFPAKALMTKQEVADQLAVSVDTIEKWCDSGDLDTRIVNEKLDPKRTHLRVTTESAIRWYNDPRRMGAGVQQKGKE